MKSEKLKIWFRATRPFSFSGSIIPVILGAVLAVKQNGFSLVYFVLSLVGIVILHAGVNLISDYNDYTNKVDTKDALGSSGVIFEKLLTAEEILKVGKIFLIIAFALGLSLSFIRGWGIFLFGMIGILGGYFYTGKPFKLKYRGFGDLLVFLLFGPLLIMGSYYIHTHTITLSTFYVSIPTGLLTTAILHANNIRDIFHDKKAKIKTLAIIVGESIAKKIYFGLIIFSYISVLIMVLYEIIPYWSLICFLTIPAAYKNIKVLYSKGETSKNIVMLDKMTAQLQGQFGIILILSILLPSIIK